MPTLSSQLKKKYNEIEQHLFFLVQLAREYQVLLARHERQQEALANKCRARQKAKMKSE